MGDVGRFIAAIGKHWLPLISGGIPCLLGIAWPYIAAAIHQPKWSANAPLWLLIAALAIGVFVACYQAWKEEHLEVVRCKEDARPKLKLSFSPHDPGCVKRFIKVGDKDGKELKGTFYRVKVETDGLTQVNACCGRLRSIKRDDVEIFSGQPCRLPFTPSERKDAISKTVHDNIPEYLDCVLITGDNKVFIWASDDDAGKGGKYGNLLAPSGDYQFDISVVSDTPSVHIRLALRWRGAQQTAEMICATVVP